MNAPQAKTRRRMIALTHLPSPRLALCELTHLDRSPIAIELALAQHASYRDALQEAGCSVRAYDFNRDLADASFVEDVAVVLDEIVVMGTMGVKSREAESKGWKEILSEFGNIAELPDGAKLEGGDVLLMGRDLLIGHSTRTNRIAIDAVAKIVREYGYVVHPVPVRGCLHLKTACTVVDDETLLLNPNWIDCRALPNKKRIVAADEWGANVVRLPDRLLSSAENKATTEQLQHLGYAVTTVALSEFAKAEAGATCLSLLIASA
jgi:dimethylargininase